MHEHLGMTSQKYLSGSSLKSTCMSVSLSVRISSVWLGGMSTLISPEESVWKQVGVVYKSQISDRCQWDAPNVVIPK